MSDDLFGVSSRHVRSRPADIDDGTLKYFRYLLPVALAPSCCEQSFSKKAAVELVLRFIEVKADVVLAQKGRKGTWLLFAKRLGQSHRGHA